jgi:hypothetical protein
VYDQSQPFTLSTSSSPLSLPSFLPPSLLPSLPLLALGDHRSPLRLFAYCRLLNR